MTTAMNRLRAATGTLLLAALNALIALPAVAGEKVFTPAAFTGSSDSVLGAFTPPAVEGNPRMVIHCYLLVRSSGTVIWHFCPRPMEPDADFDRMLGAMKSATLRSSVVETREIIHDALVQALDESTHDRVHESVQTSVNEVLTDAWHAEREAAAEVEEANRFVPVYARNIKMQPATLNGKPIAVDRGGVP